MTTLSTLQQKVLAALDRYGPITDERLIRLPAFRRYAPSTVRTRRAELTDPIRTDRLGTRPFIREVGTRTNARGRTVSEWGLTGRGTKAIKTGS